MLDEKLLVFVLGAPGAGKGTQCDLIVEEYGWTHISAGDLLRAQVAAGTEVGKQAEEYLRQGTMVPASMIIGLLKEALSDAQHTRVLIDGFPRVLDQLKEFEQQVRPCDKALFYNIPEEVARDRLLKRGDTSGRVDDNAETIRKRFVVFKTESMPVITELMSEGRVAEFDAAGPREEVFAATSKVIEQLQQQQQQRAGRPQEQQQQQQKQPSKTAADAMPAEATAVAHAESPAAPASPAAVMPGLPGDHTPALTAASAARPNGPAAAVVAHASIDSAAAAASSPPAPVSGSPAHAAQASHAAQEASTAVGEAPAVPASAGSAAEVAAVAAAEGAEAASPTEVEAPPPVMTATGPVSPSAQPQPAASTPVPAATNSASKVQPAADSSEAASQQANTAIAEAATAAAGLAELPAMSGTIASLQVDLSGIRTPVVICGPSGVGKGTLINKLMTQFADRFGFSVSHTTRAPRPGEVHGKHYYFTNKEAMAEQVAAGLFLEHALVHGNMYGTSLAAVAQVSAAGKHCVLDIDVQGAAQVRKSALGPHCLFIFVAPPSHEELERRLRNRGTETEDKVLQRLANAESEIAKAQEPGLFHHVLVNAELEVAYQELTKLISQRVPGLLPSSSQPQQQPQSPAAVPAKPSSGQQEPGSMVANGTADKHGSATEADAGAVASPAAGAKAGEAVALTLAAATTAGLAGSVAANSSAAQQQQQQEQQQQQHVQQLQPMLANGNGTICAAPAAVGGTATLLDFGFGASAGPAVAAKGMPVRQYMDATVIPVLREGLKALNVARPDDPLQFLADYLVAHKAAAA